MSQHAGIRNIGLIRQTFSPSFRERLTRTPPDGTSSIYDEKIRVSYLAGNDLCTFKRGTGIVIAVSFIQRHKSIALKPMQ
ncbi:conserved domain protein [Ruminococcus albus 8]|uniref:Conserved domain protein n=1 Tax=Ruminococcus albus 8 TaxID=246199 RepID=E9SBV8_RUMAL|nr:conserved domain protein [Ruminococcus albus 8]